MSSYERCWREAGGDAERYYELCRTRPACTPEEQAGEDARVCAACGRRAVHQHAGECMACEDAARTLQQERALHLARAMNAKMFPTATCPRVGCTLPAMHDGRCNGVWSRDWAALEEP